MQISIMEHIEIKLWIRDFQNVHEIHVLWKKIVFLIFYMKKIDLPFYSTFEVPLH